MPSITMFLIAMFFDQSAGQCNRRPATGWIGLWSQALRNCSRNSAPRSCGIATSTTQNPGKSFSARAADSLKRRSRVRMQ